MSIKNRMVSTHTLKFTLFMLAGLTVSQAGCLRAAQRTLTEAKGAEAEITIVPGTSIANFNAYDDVSVSAPRTRLGSLVPSSLSSTLPGALKAALTTGEKAPFSGGGNNFSISGEVMWYHERGGLGVITGSKSYAVVLLDLQDGGQALGRLQVVASSGASRTGPEDMAEAVAEAVAEWFEERVSRG